MFNDKELEKVFCICSMEKLLKSSISMLFVFIAKAFENKPKKNRKMINKDIIFFINLNT